MSSPIQEPETVPVVQPGDGTRSLWERISKALGPSLPGIVLDLADALALTRYVSPFLSFPVGLIIGGWLSSYYSFSLRWKCLIAIGSGLYTLTPGTEAIPLATILTCLGRFIENAPDPVQSSRSNAMPSVEPIPKPETESATTASGTSQRSDRSRAKCPECGSVALRYGEVGQRFWPEGKSTWSKGHEVNAFVCLDCGFVGHYLSAADLENLTRS